MQFSFYKIFLICLVFTVLSACGQKIAEKTESISDKITLVNLIPGQPISSPFELRGQAKGFWFFEASFPVELVDESGNTLAQTYASTRGNWMTEKFVPFDVNLEFDKPETKKGYILLKRANASGLPEHDETLKVPVTF